MHRSLRISLALVKRWYACKACGKDIGVHPSPAIDHVTDCARLVEIAVDENTGGDDQMKRALLALCQMKFKTLSSQIRAKELRSKFSPQATLVSEHSTVDDVMVVESELATTGVKKYMRPPSSSKKISKMNKALSEFVIESSLPFRLTSSPAFFKFMHAVRPDLFSEIEKAQINSGAALTKQPKNIRGRVWHATTGLHALHEKRMDAVLRVWTFMV